MGSYWNTGAQLTQVKGETAGATVDGGPTYLTVDETTTYQKWTGWGGTFNEKGWDALSVVSDQIPTALKLLFDPNDGLGFIYGRVPMGASDYAMSWYTYDDTADPDYSMASFSIARDEQMLIPYIKAALQIQPKLWLWASPWNPPNWMRDGTTGDMKSDAQTLGAYALYQAMMVEAYAQLGLTIQAIHPQNEPGYAYTQWPGSLYVDFIKTYLGPTLAQQKVPAQVWCGTMSAPSDGTLAMMVAADSTAMMYVKGFGLQWNTGNVVSALTPKAPVMQTEHKCGNYPFAAYWIDGGEYWDGAAYNSNMAPNDHAYGEESWQLICDWIHAGVSSYSAWNMVLDTIGMSLADWPQNALLVVDRTAKTLTATPAYYAFRHFSLVLPGATRIAISGSYNAVAFKNPDGRIITEVYNSGDSSNATTVGVGTTWYQFDVPGHGWATLSVMP